MTCFSPTWGRRPPVMRYRVHCPWPGKPSFHWAQRRLTFCEPTALDIWIAQDIPVEIDFVSHEAALRSALSMGPGLRDAALSLALTEDGVLLEDEPYADWAVRPREALELLRQRARLELARDRMSGPGQAQPHAVASAWENCLSHDPASEEAASALMHIYAASGRQALVATTYERARAALEELGLRASPALENARRTTIGIGASAFGADDDNSTAFMRSPGSLKHEQRLITALFAELTPPIGIGQRLDPEDLRDAVGGALARVIAEVETMRGTVTSVSGAGLVAMFGAPEAHEDDPERAVRAGCRALSAIGGDSHDDGTGQFSLRIGIETGRAVVGPLTAGSAPNYAAVGEVVVIAAALQSTARTGTVLVGPATRAAAEDVFEWGPSEEVAPSPLAKPLTCYYVEHPKARRSGYHGGQRGQARLVDRQEELRALGEALRAALAGKGSVVLLVGEAGLGKTRLVQECRKRFTAWVGAGTGRLPLWLEGHGASYTSSIPYGLYQQLLSSLIGVAPEEDESVVDPAFRRAMRAIFGKEVEDVDFLAHMLGIGPRQGLRGLVGLSPEALQQATFAAVRALVARLAEAGPTVLVLEDLHWADPTSLRLTEELADIAAASALLVLATRRPELASGELALQGSLRSKGVCQVHRIDLSPLPAGDERELARSLVGGTIGREVIDAVCTNTEGNPLFLEERFSSLVESGALFTDEGRWSVRPAPGAPVPDVLERLVRTRIDRLEAGLRNVITAASVLGREFAISSLLAVTDLEGSLPEALGQLCTAGLLSEVRRAPEPVYRFRHALIQEATYDGLLRRQRRELHARAAWGLESLAADRLVEVASVLGHHYATAGEHERAVHHLAVAGDYATSIFANDEAVACYERALAIIERPGASTGQRDASVTMRAKLAQTLQYTGKYAKAREVLAEALRLSAPDNPLQAARLYARVGGRGKLRPQV